VTSSTEKGHDVVAGKLSEVSSQVSPEGHKFWLKDIDISDADLCFLRSFGPGSTEQLTRRISMAEHLEVAGIKVVNSTYPFRKARDKYATQYTLKNFDLPVAMTYTTENMTDAYHWNQEQKDVVYKPILGSMGKGSLKFEDADLAFNAYKMLDRLYQPYILQKFIPNPGRDIRIFVIGEEVIGCAYKYSKEGSWKTNVAQGGIMIPEEMPEEILKIGVKATKAMELDYSGVDIIESPEGPIILEVNGAPGWQALKDVTSINVAEKIVSYAESLING
jgi:ribosomal protein S6--L-glutamate ligase